MVSSQVVKDALPDAIFPAMDGQENGECCGRMYQIVICVVIHLVTGGQMPSATEKLVDG
jgi:hypothetical protein